MIKLITLLKQFMNPLFKQIKVLLPELCLSYPIVEVLYLFGSQVRSSKKKRSDIDVGMFVDMYEYKRKPYMDLELSIFLQDRLKLEADVVIMNFSSAIIQHEIIKTGLRIFEKSHELRAFFELNAFRDYIDIISYQKKRLELNQNYG